MAIFAQSANAQAIIHDAEHYLLQIQNAKQWAADDKVLEAVLADLRAKSGGKPPNIIVTGFLLCSYIELLNFP